MVIMVDCRYHHQQTHAVLKFATVLKFPPLKYLRARVRVACLKDRPCTPCLSKGQALYALPV
eukprot:4939753-Alexandrium_andersonii.AAC.1